MKIASMSSFMMSSPVRHCVFAVKSIKDRKRLEKLARNKIEERGLKGLSEADKDRMAKDMLYMYRRYGYSFDEYMGHRFYRKKMAERRTYVADWEHYGFADKMNDPKNDKIFDNKFLTYQKFMPFYKREVLLVDSEDDRPAFEDFTGRSGAYVVKPVKAAMGDGFRIVEEGENVTFEELMESYGGSFLLEELIVQDPELAKLHPQSVNTLRIPTIRFDDETIVFYPRLRIGQHGVRVDNAGAGGLVCNIDLESGRILSASDKAGNVAEKHPDTGEQIIGMTIPRWDEAVAMVKELAEVVPSSRYISWDLALTKDGWVMVEGNRRGQFGWQYSQQKGGRAEIEGYLKRLKKQSR